MKPAKSTKKKAAAVEPKPLNTNLRYVDEIADESIATFMALRALIHRQADEIVNLRKQLEELK